MISLETIIQIIPTNQLSLYIFDLELLILTALFAFKLPKRTLFPARVCLSLVIIFAYTALWNLTLGYVSVTITGYFLLFCLLIASLYFSFKIPLLSAIFLASAGYACQHFEYKLNQIVLALIEYNIVSLQNNQLIISLIYFAIFILFSICIYFLFAQKIKAEDSSLLENRTNIILGTLILLCATSLNIASEAYVNPLGGSLNDLIIFIISSLYDMISAILTILLLFEFFSKKKKDLFFKQESQIWQHEKKQLEISKENIDYLMILVHDLKHEIADINDIDKSQRIQKLNDDLISFSTFYKTGNDVLDLVLAERKHKLSIHEITTTVMADGSSISFMNSSDIYALFMNMFDNAIDALLKVQNHAKRTISLSIRKHMGLIFIHEENPYCGSIKFKDDIPMTDKKESIEHGYGSLSIKRIAQKYGGYVNYDVDDGVFKIDIVLDPSTT